MMLSLCFNKKNIRYRDDGGYTICKNSLDSEQFSIRYNRGREREHFMVIMILRIKSYGFNSTLLTRA